MKGYCQTYREGAGKLYSSVVLQYFPLLCVATGWHPVTITGLLSCVSLLAVNFVSTSNLRFNRRLFNQTKQTKQFQFCLFYFGSISFFFLLFFNAFLFHNTDVIISQGVDVVLVWYPVKIL